MNLRAENLPLELRQTATKSARPRIEWRRWLVALIAVGTAFVARWFASPILGNELPFFGFIAASLVAAWYGGAVVGVSALLIGLVLGEFFFTGPDLGFAVADHVELVRVLRYVGTAALGVFLIEVLHRGRLRVHQALQQREAEIRRREEFETRLGEAQAQPGAYARELEQRVTERTASLQQSVNSLENVLYHVAHDLRAPVRALSGFTNLLLTEHGPKLNADGVDYCRRIVRAAERMDALTSDLLAYGHVAAAELRIVEVDLNKVVADALQRVATSIRASNARISVASDLGRVRADSRVVGESLVELLTMR